VSVIPYFVEVFDRDRRAWRESLSDAIDRELRGLGVHRAVTVAMSEPPVGQEPTVSIYLASPEALTDTDLQEMLQASIRSGRVVFPVVERLDEYAAAVPDCLLPINGYGWSDSDPAIGLARKILEELGIEDRQRRAFISHRRDDGLVAAEQLHDHLSHNGFEPFIDRFNIGSGRDIQGEIADSLEACALVVLLETPLAYTSDWVFDEVDYALGHQLGLHIVTWPGPVKEIPGTHGLPRQQLVSSDMTALKGYDMFTDAALGHIGAAVEDEHVRALLRRRRYLLRSIEEAAEDEGLVCTPLPGWRLFVKDVTEPDVSSLVQVSPRLPTVEDLHSLDEARLVLSGSPPGVLVHAARTLPASRRRLLAWAAGRRNLALVPENAVGGYWRSL
jgi:hypothetical protein